jgi:hypothetical protein
MHVSSVEPILYGLLKLIPHARAGDANLRFDFAASQAIPPANGPFGTPLRFHAPYFVGRFGIEKSIKTSIAGWNSCWNYLKVLMHSGSGITRAA